MPVDAAKPQTKATDYAGDRRHQLVIPAVEQHLVSLPEDATFDEWKHDPVAHDDDAKVQI